MKRKQGNCLKQFKIARIFLFICFLLLILLIPPANTGEKINLERLQKILEWTLADSSGESLESMFNSAEPEEVSTEATVEVTRVDGAAEKNVVVQRKPGKQEVVGIAKPGMIKNDDSTENEKVGGKTSKSSSSSSKSTNWRKDVEAPVVDSTSVKGVLVEDRLSEFQKTLAEIQNSLKKLEKSKIELEKLRQQYCDKDGFCDGKKRMKKRRFFRRLKIPEGSSLSLDVQLSNPNVLTGLFFQPEGIILDAVLEVPMWIDLPKYAEFMYKNHYGQEAESGGGEGGEDEDPPGAIEKRSFLGSERCYIYRKMEHYTAVFLHVPPTTAHHCLLRTICEIHSMLSFWSSYENASLVFELLNLILTPSLGKEDDCHQPYRKAEMTGKTKKLCYRYRKDCPISLAAIIVSNFVPSFSLL